MKPAQKSQLVSIETSVDIDFLEHVAEDVNVVAEGFFSPGVKEPQASIEPLIECVQVWADDRDVTRFISIAQMERIERLLIEAGEDR